MVDDIHVWSTVYNCPTYIHIPQIEVVEALDVRTQSRAEIVVITPYKAQQRLITTRIGEANKKWRVKTVDASQGKAANNLNNTLRPGNYGLMNLHCTLCAIPQVVRLTLWCCLQ